MKRWSVGLGRLSGYNLFSLKGLRPFCSDSWADQMVDDKYDILVKQLEMVKKYKAMFTKVLKDDVFKSKEEILGNLCLASPALKGTSLGDTWEESLIYVEESYENVEYSLVRIVSFLDKEEVRLNAEISEIEKVFKKREEELGMHDGK